MAIISSSMFLSVSTAAIAKTTDTATQFVILEVADGPAGIPITVTVEAQNKKDEVDVSYQADVTLITDGSATGAGLVNIVNGVGTIQINDYVAEKVELSLSDTEGTGLDVKSKQKVTFLESSITPLSGGGDRMNVLRINGQAFPGARVFLIAKSSDGEELVKQDLGVSWDGTFGIIDGLVRPGYYTYALVVKDPNGRQSQIKVYNTDFIANTHIEINNVFVSPTIALTRAAITKGDFIKIFGYAFPRNRIVIKLDGGMFYETESDSQGKYSLLINTAQLEFGYHNLCAKQINPTTGKESDFSLLREFLVSSSIVPKADFNGDGRINISDWSIFLIGWGQKDAQFDLNEDGQVNVSDLSVLLRAIKTQ